MNDETLQAIEGMFTGIYPGHSQLVCVALDSGFFELEECKELNAITQPMLYTVYYEFNFTLACLLLLDMGEEL